MVTFAEWRPLHQRKHSMGIVHLAIHDPHLKSFLMMHRLPMRRIIQARSVVCPADARSDADGIALRGCGWRRRSRALCCAGSFLTAGGRAADGGRATAVSCGALGRSHAVVSLTLSPFSRRPCWRLPVRPLFGAAEREAWWLDACTTADFISSIVF